MDKNPQSPDHCSSKTGIEYNNIMPDEDSDKAL
jgi:hypothetical protein